MDRAELLQLIKKVITGTVSKKEEEVVDRDFFDPFVSGHWAADKMGEKREVQKKIVKNIRNGLARSGSRANIQKLVIITGKIAAAIILFSIVAFYGLRFMPNRSIDRVEELTSSLQPGKEKASLTLGNGTILDLEDLSVGNAFEGADFVVIKTEEGRLEYRYHERLGNQSVNEEWNVLTTPMGGHFKIALADGTKVWLNAESSLAFPENFSEDARRVKVSGEVYFEVSYDQKRPFIVNAKEMDIQVLGTSFNVSNYEDNAYPTVSLIEGAVQVNAGSSVSKLAPGKQASIDNGQIHVGPFDIESAIAWKDDYFLFKDRNIKEIMSDLARWYDAEIEYEGENWVDKNYTLRISRRKNIGEILSILELTESIKFKVTGRRIVVVA